jgi:hypothetical protein
VSATREDKIREADRDRYGEIARGKSGFCCNTESCCSMPSVAEAWARQVGPDGHVIIGVDITADMISKARRAADEGGYGNIEFRLGEKDGFPAAGWGLHRLGRNRGQEAL